MRLAAMIKVSEKSMAYQWSHLGQANPLGNGFLIVSMSHFRSLQFFCFSVALNES